MLEKKRIYISDVHMGAGRQPKKGQFSYDWLGPEEAEVFANFLEFLIKDEEVEEIILLGDTMDNWVCPVDEDPPTFEEIIKARQNKKITEKLKILASLNDKKLIFMPGNHDMQITKDVLEKAFPGIIYGGSAANKSVYRTSRLRAEHGSAYAMFNAPDPINNPGNRLPLGYFISRVAATKHSRTGSANRHFWTYADDFLEMLGPQKLPQSVFEAIVEESGLDDNTDIKMGNGNTVKIKEIKDKYSNLYEQWKIYYGKGFAFKAVLAEIGYLEDFADMLTKKGDTNIVIFGHSHESELDKDKWFVEDRIYANCGSWCDKEEPCSYIETRKNNEERIHYIKLYHWENNKPVEIKSESIQL